MKFDWIPEFDVNIKRGHLILYVVVTILIVTGGRWVYEKGHRDGWISCLQQHEHMIDWKR